MIIKQTICSRPDGLIHLIPRRKGDVDNPRGGVRHVISGKGSYFY